jgi:UDP-glucose 4-epimerase
MNPKKNNLNTILITGGAGNVGSALAQALSNDPNNFIIIFDNLCTGSVHKVPIPKFNNVRFIKGDVNVLNDISSLMLCWNFDYIFHYAALVGVKKTLANPIDVLQDIDGIRNLLQLAKNTNVKRVFFSSSSEVYGEPVEFPQNEHTTPLNSRLPYAIVKNVAEAFFRSYQKEYGLNYTIFRFFNTYGPKQSTEFVLPRFIDLALRDENITLYGDGSQTRTFCYIDDNIEATLKIFREGLHINEVVNIGSHIETPIIELARRIIKITGSNSIIEHLPPLEEGDMTRRLPDNSKMLKVLARDLLPLDDGIRNVLRLRFGFEC